jgi:hypothetical protein
MDGIHYHFEQDKPSLERQLSHVFAHIQNLDLNNDKIIIT